MAKISVIVPLYNKEKYIGRAIDSILAQTFGDFEVIVVDDGSSDSSAKIIRGYDDKRIRLVSQANAGPGAARNKGISESRCELLSFLDADDEWMPQFLEKSFTMLENNPDCDLTACTYFSGPQKTDLTGLFEKFGMKGGKWQIENNLTDRQLRTSRYFLNLINIILCRQGVIERYNGFRTKNRCDYGEDTYLLTQLMFNHKIYRIMEPLLWYHSEASELGPGRKNTHPLDAFLADPDPIRKNCRAEFRELLERYFTLYALATAHEFAAGSDNIYNLHYLLEEFPKMKKYRLEYMKLRLKMFLPELVPIVRYAKNIVRISAF